ncbi:MAG: extracellular solute-binding protein [Chloroflexi bacterium]|nr:extracellular solute-binding protein [Chloroflexota bacterium]
MIALPEQLLNWQENIVDLTPYLVQPEFGMDLADIPAAFAEQSLVNGVRYGLPAARSARLLFYNRTFARDLGFDAAPNSADEFRKQACAANAFWKQDADLTNDGFGGLALDVASNWQTPYSWLAASGGQIFTDGEFRFNTPDNSAALQFVSDLRADGCAWLATSSSNYEYLAGRSALFITGNLSELAEQKNAFATSASADEWTVLPFPGEKPGIVAYGPDYAVLKTNEARQLAAWLFIRWMLEPQNQARWVKESGLFPVSMASADLLKSQRAANPQWSAAIDLIPLAKPYPQTAEWQLANKILADGFMAYFGSFPNATLEGVFKVMDATVKELKN